MKIFQLLIIFLAACANASAHGVTDADKLSLVNGGNMDYIRLGATHMLTGYDHLLFLFGVIFFLSRFKDILKFITAFTLGHSITLIFATLFEIKANYFLIDAVIALTVCYKGFENIGGFQKWLKMKSPNLMAAVFLFGLIHGFGLSTRLQQLPLGDDGLIGKIISFNVGVEVGQVIALSIMLFLLSGWQKTKSFSQFSTVSNWGLILIGLGLFFFQVAGYVDSQPKHAKSTFELQHDSSMHEHGDGHMHAHHAEPEPAEIQVEAHDHQHGGAHGHTH